jgi:hypothetical protein
VPKSKRPLLNPYRSKPCSDLVEYEEYVVDFIAVGSANLDPVEFDRTHLHIHEQHHGRCRESGVEDTLSAA